MQEKKGNSSKNKKDHGIVECTSKSLMNITGSQQEMGKNNPFRKSTKKAKEDFFDVDYEDSKVDATISGTLSQNSDIIDCANIFKNPKKIGMTKKKVEDPFNVDFEDSKDGSSQIMQISSQKQSQKSNETLPQDTYTNIKKTSLFKTPKLHSNNAFDIDFEESGQTLTQQTQHSQASGSSSQTSTDALSQDGIGRPSLFQPRKRRLNNAFEVDFEESSQTDTPEHSSNIQVSQSPDNIKENVEELTSVSFEKLDPFKEAKKKRMNKPFDVDFEESKIVTNVLSGTITPTKSGMIPFRKTSQVPKEDDFDVNLSQTKTADDSMVKCRQSMTDNGSSLFGNRSSASELNGSHKTEIASDFNQSSFNDENLQQWMSDQSVDEIEIGKNENMETSGRKTLPPDEISPPSPAPDIQREDHMKQLQLKLQEIVDNARNGKVRVRSSAPVPESPKEKPKKFQNNRKAFMKPTLKKPAKFATKRLYSHILTKIRPRYGLDSVVQAEELVIYMCDVVKTVIRRKGYQKKLINDLKMEMAKMGVIETTYQFYEFIREYLPYEFRLKSVPCIQPGTNIVFPPKDAVNPFQKIL